MGAGLVILRTNRFSYSMKMLFNNLLTMRLYKRRKNRPSELMLIREAYSWNWVVYRMDCEAHDIQLLVISPCVNVACGSQSTHYCGVVSSVCLM